MAQTVIGMFDNSSEAQAAVQELVGSGISRDRIDISGRGSSSSSGTSASGTSHLTGAGNDHHESGISKFFKSLFGDDNDDDADKYSRVASRSECIVTVHLQEGEDAERVADVLDDHGAVNVDDHAAKYGYSNTTGSTSGSGMSGMGSGMSGMGSGSSSATGLGTSDLGGTGLSTGAAGGMGAAGFGLTGAGLSDVGSGTGSSSGLTGTSGMGNSDLSGTSGMGGSGLTGTSGTDFTETTGTGSGTTGSEDFSTNRMGTGTTGSDLNTNLSGNESRSIPIIEENLEVGKREIQTGGVRVRSRVIERPVEEAVRLRHERVNIERHAVDRPVSDADMQNFKERDIEMVEHAEVPVVNKSARVVEEVSVGKEVEERNETISDTVRKTEVDVENLEGDKNSNRSNTDNNNSSTTNSGIL